MDHEIFYAAMLARDHRFDGKFYIGVKTTGIYCRPICPASPKRENVEFFLTARHAEKSGYRPCLRCRPECAPLSPAWQGRSAVVQRALKFISTDGFFEMNEDKFAGQFGVTARHLRRLFTEEIGLTPKKIAFNNRLGFAQKLIAESNLPMTSVALVSGFSSLRRFNDAFKKRFHRAPSYFRRKSTQASADLDMEANGVLLTLPYRPPLDWSQLLQFYQNHRIIGVETVTNDSYERLFCVGGTPGLLRVTNDSARSRLKLQISHEDPSVLFPVSQKVRQMFDLDSDPLLVANSFQSQKILNSLWMRQPGLRLARGWDPFETAICTILGQLVSVQQANALIAQLVKHRGQKVENLPSGKTGFLFPSPTALAQADLGEIKTTESRKATIRELARQVSSGQLDLLTPQDSTLLKTQLLSIPGIGPWSSEYISLRALGDTDAFPETDLILKRALKRHLGLDLNKVRPWRSYAAVYLWTRYATELSGTKRRRKS